MTSLQMELHVERKERLARFAMRAALLKRMELQRQEVNQPPPVEPVEQEDSEAPAFDLTWVEPGKLTIRDVQFFIANKYGVRRADLLSDRRTGKLIAPRQVAIWLCHRIFPCSLNDIGIKFRRDHTTVLHSIKRVKARILGDSAYCLAIGKLEEELKPYAPAEDA